jgi:hypothetical protein
MDDIAIHTKPVPGETTEQHQQRHRQHMHHVLEKLEKNKLYIKPSKCEFEKEEIEYLGIIVGQNKLRMDPGKLKGIADWPVPRNPAEVQQFLGFTGYYRYFVPNHSKIARPLLDLTKKHECVAVQSSRNPTSMKNSTFKQMHQLTVWGLYSRKKGKAHFL